MLDYEYLKNDYKLIAADFSRQEELGVDTRPIQQAEFVEWLNKNDLIVVNKSLFVLKILENIKEKRLNFHKEV